MNATSLALSLVTASLLAISVAQAQQVTGTPDSPGATTTIDGKQLPPPDPKFGGVIKEKASESTAWWAPQVVPPKGGPRFGEAVRPRRPDRPGAAEGRLTR